MAKMNQGGNILERLPLTIVKPRHNIANNVHVTKNANNVRFLSPVRIGQAYQGNPPKGPIDVKNQWLLVIFCKTIFHQEKEAENLIVNNTSFDWKESCLVFLQYLLLRPVLIQILVNLVQLPIDLEHVLYLFDY